MLEQKLAFDVQRIRAEFPAITADQAAGPRTFFDNPAGTQVPQRVVQRMTQCLVESNANLGGCFPTSIAAESVLAQARAAMADLLNAPSSDEIVFGQNMTSLTFHLSRSIGRKLSAGDEIVLTRMDHDANVSPWLLLARDAGLHIKWLPFNLETFEFDLVELERLLTDRTRLVCFGGASNLTGTLQDVKSMCDLARQAGAWTYVDAVQSVPHVSTDVQDTGCDFLVCSAYKFFGPHQGILYGRRDCLEQLEPYKVRPAPDQLPGCFETGTQSHEGIAGVAAAVDYLAWIGETFALDYHSRYPNFTGRRKAVHAAMDCLFNYERTLTERLICGLQQLPGVKIQGISNVEHISRRVPTVSLTVEGQSPQPLAQALARENIFVWSGHNYALEAATALGTLEHGGVLRIGPVHYNTLDEVDRLLEALGRLL